jgi:hypothetical protein
MTVRRLLITLILFAGFVAGIAVAQRGATTSAAITTFGRVPFASRPHASHGTPVTTTWYCPGVPASDPTVGGKFVISNPTDVPLSGRITFLGPEGTTPVTQPLSAPARDRLSIDAESVMTASYVAAVVEIDGGEGMVEQQALFPAGNAVVSCTTETSPKWYFADGWTAEGSTEQLVIANPYEDTVTFDVAFFTKNGVKREPGPFQGASINPHSVRVIDVAGSGFTDEQIIGVQVVASRGRLLVERAEHSIGGGRLGYNLTMGAPAPSEQLWFVEGENGPDIHEQYVIFNPTSDDAAVDLVVLGVPVTTGYVAPDSIAVPAGEVVTFDTSSITGLPAGPHSIVFSTLAAPSVVIERVLTKPSGGGPVTTVVMGMTPEFVVPRWYLPIGVDEATDAAIVVYNPDQAAKTVALKAVGPGGEVAVPGLDAIELPAGGIATIPLTDPSVFGKTLVVEGTGRIFVERKLPRGNNLAGRSGSWALPECGPCSLQSPPSS